MSEKKVELSDLLEQGRNSGKLSASEITDALEELDFDSEQMDQLYSSLETQSIEIVEDLPEEGLDDLSLPKEYLENEAALTEGLDDPVKMYLKEA